MSATISATNRSNTRTGLRSLLGTMEPQEFLQEYLGKRMLHVSGAGDHFAELFSWADLNKILNSQFVPYSRARLVVEGRGVDEQTYTYEEHGHRWLDSAICQRLMSEGATLIVLGVGQVNPRLNALIRSLEKELGASVDVGIVATFAGVPGLNTHWDSAECLNIQVYGEKEWTVTRPERLHPLTPTPGFRQRIDITRSAPPNVPPTWSGVIAPGDLIYLPRGWWHAVRPVTVPSLHLSIAADVPTFSDFIAWCALQSNEHEAVRRIIPTWGTPVDRSADLADALEAVSKSLSAEALETYLAHITASAKLRPMFALPDSAAPGSPRLNSTTKVCARLPRSLSLVERDGIVSLVWKGKEYKFDARVRPAIEKLNGPGDYTLTELSEGIQPVLVTALVLTLLTAGALAVVGDRESLCS